MAADWQATAARLIRNGYAPGNAWENLLRRSLAASNPGLERELGPACPAYLAVRTARAKEMYERLLGQGTDPQTARELAMAELLSGGGGGG